MDEPGESKPSVPPEHAASVAEHFFRHEGGKLVASLTRIFGVQHLSLAEDVVQDALARALQVWPYYGVPANPSAWLTQVAKNLALDVVRREKSFRDKEPAIIATIEPRADASPDETVRFDEEIRDDRLRLLFVCCHPVLPEDAQVALALKTLCGFSTIEISRAFLTNEPAIAKRLTRAKQRLRDANIPFEIPSGEDLGPRLDGVLQSIYLLFNEGYKASSGDQLVREDLCQEAIRLCAFLAEHPSGDRPRTHALLALMLFNAARLKTRTDAEGNILRLSEQTRTEWNHAMISRGVLHLARSATGADLSQYHLQAGIAACHCTAADEASTDWRQILSLYDQLIRIDQSPVVALNRAVAIANVHGPAAGIDALEAIEDSDKLKSYHLLYAVRGELEWRLDRKTAAAEHFRKALALAETKSEQTFLSKRLEDCRVAG